MNIIDNMGYSQWQKRNTNAFNKLSTNQKQQARSEGYFNVGWDKVKKSWEILLQSSRSSTLFDLKLKKGDMPGAINQSILEAEKAQEIARNGISKLDQKLAKLNKISAAALKKHQLL
jgi:hypothetical protein